MTPTLLLFVLTLVPGDLLAQTAPPGGAPYRQYATAEGLPHENVMALTQAADHRLYVGTLLGLAVYDGAQFHTVPLPDSVREAPVHELLPRSDGTVWASVGSRHLAQVRGRELLRLLEIPGGVQRLLVRRDTLYAFTGGDGYWTLPPEETQPVHHSYSFPWRLWRSPDDSTSGRGVKHAALSPSGQIWIVDGRRGPGRLKPDGSVAFVGVPEARATHWWTRIEFFGPDRALLTRGETVFRFNTRTGRLHVLCRAPGAFTTYRQNDRLTYLKGNVRRRVPGNTALPGLRTWGLPVRTASHALVDHEGGLWLGTRAGLFHLYARGVRHVRQIGETTLSNANVFTVDGDSTLWAMSWGSGLLRIRPNPATFQPDGETQWSTVRSKTKRTHALSAAGWYRHEPAGGWRRVGAFQEAIRGVVERNGLGYFWHDDGLYRHVPDSPTPPAPLFRWPTSQRDFNMIGPHQNGGIVLRSRDRLYRARPSAEPDTTSVPALEPLARLPGYETARGRMLAADRRGVVWLAFWERGLLRVDTRTSPARLDSLLVGQPLRHLSLSGDSLVFVSAQDGLYVVDAPNGRLRRHLTTEHGLLGNTTGDAIVHDDTLYVSHQHGITKMPLRILRRRPSAPEVLLTSVERSGEEFFPESPSDFPIGDRAVGFNFAAPTFRTPSRVRYEYRLTPREDRWQESKRSFASYTNLPPGPYHFEVRARTGTGPIGPAATYSFRIPRFFYETAWFRLLVGLALLALGGAAYRWRVRHLRRRQRELERAVDDRTQQLQREKRTTEEQADRLAELDEAKNRFFANVSHELRTPLTLIVEPIRSLLAGEQGSLTDDQAHQLRLMRRNADRLLELIGQLLDLARLDAGQMELQPQRGNLITFLQQRIQAFEPLAERTRVALHFRPDTEELRFPYDPDKLRKVVDNLLSNALSFTPEGGDVWVSTHRLQTDSSVEVVVKDTGPGIPEETVEQLFNRFTQGDDTAHRQHEGAGIGLALARELVELHGGTIRVRSEAGHGAAFIVRLPVNERDHRHALSGADGEREDAEPMWHDPQHGAPAIESRTLAVEAVARGQRETEGDPFHDENRPSKILVVEDNEEVRLLLRRQLTPTHEVVEAADGRAGLEAAREHEPDLIISDVMMPEMDGFALCEAVKTDETLAVTPVLLLTAKAGPAHVREGLEHGADAYVSKPFDAEVLHARVNNLIESRRRLQEIFGTQVLVESSGEAVSEETASFLETVLAVIEDRIGDSGFTVEDLAAEVALSRRQLARRLKDATGEPPAELIRRVRFQHAARMLKRDDYSVSEVAYAVGYESPSHFSRAFRKRFNCVPSDYDGTA